MSSSILVFDLETQLLSDDVGGWDHIAQMKLACAVTHDMMTNTFHEYTEADAPKLIADLKAARARRRVQRQTIRLRSASPLRRQETYTSDCRFT